MQRLKTITLAPADPADTDVCLGQTPAGGGVQNLAINGLRAAAGVATLDMPRRVQIKSNANDSARTFTLQGIDRYGRVIGETLKGPNAAAVVSLKDYAKVTLVQVDANTAGQIKVGTCQVLSSAWLPVDRYNVMDLGFCITIEAGEFTFTVEGTADDPFTMNDIGPNPDIYLRPFPHPNVNQRANASPVYDSFESGLSAVRLTVNAYTAAQNGVLRGQFAPGFSGGTD